MGTRKAHVTRAKLVILLAASFGAFVTTSQRVAGMDQVLQGGAASAASVGGGGSSSAAGDGGARVVGSDEDDPEASDQEWWLRDIEKAVENFTGRVGTDADPTGKGMKWKQKQVSVSCAEILKLEFSST